MAKQIKSLPGGVKAVEGRTVTGIASVFGNVDSWRDVIHPGAFQKTITEQRGRLKHFWNHSWYSPPIAVITSIREVGRDELPDQVLSLAPEASGGLEVTREYLDTPRGNEILEGIKAGAISEMSIGYDAIRYDFEEVGQEPNRYKIRNLREIRLWETSDVVWGANDATSASKAEALLATPLQDLLLAIKAGTIEKDEELVKAIQSTLQQLGADDGNASAEDERRAGPHKEAPLTLYAERLRLLELSIS